MSTLQSLSAVISSFAILAQQDGGGARSAMGFGFICVFALVGLAVMAFWIWTIVDAVRNPNLNDNTRLIWILVIVLTGAIGSIIYLIAGRGPKAMQ